MSDRARRQRSWKYCWAGQWRAGLEMCRFGREPLDKLLRTQGIDLAEEPIRGPPLFSPFLSRSMDTVNSSPIGFKVLFGTKRTMRRHTASAIASWAMRLYAEHRQEARLRAQYVNLLRLRATHQRECPALRKVYLLERMVLALDVGILAGRRPIAQNANSRRMQPDGGQTLRMRVGERTQQQRVHYAENRRIGADSDA